jgi:hypothetical protein
MVEPPVEPLKPIVEVEVTPIEKQITKLDLEPTEKPEILEQKEKMDILHTITIWY